MVGSHEMQVWMFDVSDQITRVNESVYKHVQRINKNSRIFFCTILHGPVSLEDTIAVERMSCVVMFHDSVDVRFR